MALLNRLNTDKSLAPLVTQFVPLKVDVSTPEFASLRGKHQSEGNSIPIIFLIRADGKKLYAKSGSLPGNQLPTLMTLAVRDMGRPLGVSEAKALTEINAKIETALKQNSWKETATLFKKVKPLGAFGKIRSYAKSATKNNALAQQFQTSVKGLVDQYTSWLDSDSTRIKAAIQSLQLKSDLGTLTTFRIPLNQLEKKVRSVLSSTQEFSNIKDVAAAIDKLARDTARSQALLTLNSFASSTQNEQAKQFISKLIETSETSAAKTGSPLSALRTWTSDNGKFTVEGSLVKYDGVNVTLKKKNGAIISVPLNRLSTADKNYVTSRK